VSGSDASLAWALGIAVALIFVPPLVWLLVKRFKHKQRRRLVDSPRKIAIVSAGDDAARGCEHQRSKSRARTAADGTVYSTCKRCGVTMKRLGPGEWEPA
jgi:hypothetical protein